MFSTFVVELIASRMLLLAPLFLAHACSNITTNIMKSTSLGCLVQLSFSMAVSCLFKIFVHFLTQPSYRRHR